MEARDLDEKKFKLEKKIGADVAKEMQASDGAKLKEVVVSLSKDIENIETAKADDGKLNTLKEQLKDLNGAYGDARKEKKQKLQYAILLLQERGEG